MRIPCRYNIDKVSYNGGQDELFKRIKGRFRTGNE